MKFSIRQNNNELVLIDSHKQTLSHSFDIVDEPVRKIEEQTNIAIPIIGIWLDEAGLTLAAHKIKAALISSRKKVKRMEVTVGDTKIRSKRITSAKRYL